VAPAAISGPGLQPDQSKILVLRRLCHINS